MILYRNNVITDSEAAVRSLLSELVEAASGGFEWGNGEFYPVRLVCTELVANAVYHGNGGTGKKAVYICLELEGAALKLTVRDSGPGFVRRKPSCPEDLFSESGRGLAIVNAICREVKYNEAGNEVCVSLPLPKAVRL